MRLVVAVVCGAVFGAVTSLVNNIPGLLGEVGLDRAEQSPATWIAEFTSNLLDSGWAWAGLAVVAGWLARSLPGAAVNGPAALIAATLAYYGADEVFGIDLYWGITSYWIAAAVLFGPLLGLAGAAVHRPGLPRLLGGLLVPAGAAAQMVIFPMATGLEGESSAEAWAQGAVWVAAAAGAALVVTDFLRTRRRAVLDPAAKTLA